MGDPFVAAPWLLGHLRVETGLPRTPLALHAYIDLRAIRTPRASVAATGCQHMPTELDMLSNTGGQLLNTSEGGLGDAITAPAHRMTVS